MPKANSRQHAPYLPFDYTENETRALKALAAGTANEGQQKTALSVIVNKICKTYDLPYFPDSVRDSDFAQGKRFVGLQIVKHINLTTEGKQDA